MTAPLAGQAREIAGAAHVILDPAALTAYEVDGVRPAVAARPGTAEEAAALIALAAKHRAGVLPWGAGVHQHLGGVPARADLVIDTRRLNGITDYEPADYVVAVRAGTPLRDLQAELRRHTQWLPLDPPGGDEATVGGIIAANRSGPRRLLYGSVRDMLIGIRVALPTGEVIKAGGKVVKNVAGYDLTKLFIGSHGAAGVITEATFKISPLPGDGQTICAVLSDREAALRLTSAVLRSYLLPSALEALSPAAFRRLADAAGIAIPDEETWGVLMLAEGMAESRERHITEVRRLADDLGNSTVGVLDGAAQTALWREVAEFPSPRVHPRGIVCRAGGPIRRWGDLAAAAEGACAAGTAEIVARAGVGLVYASSAADDGPKMVAALGTAADAAGGYAVVEVAPLPLKTRLPLWGAPPEGLELMRRLREKFDPQRIMIPGRLGWGLS
jgi:glycolate dehydrogenase FAD-binding subunit